MANLLTLPIEGYALLVFQVQQYLYKKPKLMFMFCVSSEHIRQPREPSKLPASVLDVKTQTKSLASRKLEISRMYH